MCGTPARDAIGLVFPFGRWGEIFILSDEQPNFDARNYFTELFGTEGGTKETILYCDPKLFQIIEGYLSGYGVFTLPNTAIPPYMSRGTISKNVLADARFYRLNRLVDKLNLPQSRSCQHLWTRSMHFGSTTKTPMLDGE